MSLISSIRAILVGAAIAYIAVKFTDNPIYKSILDLLNPLPFHTTTHHHYHKKHKIHKAPVQKQQDDKTEQYKSKKRNLKKPPPKRPGVKRICTIGDSLTMGIRPDGFDARYTWPSFLGMYLGEEHFEVLNYAMTFRSVQKNAFNTMWDDDNFYESLQSEPDIMMIMMGCNDAQLKNFDRETFIKDLQDFVKEYQKLGSHPEIIIMTPQPIDPDDKHPCRREHCKEINNQIIPDLVAHVHQIMGFPEHNLFRTDVLLGGHEITEHKQMYYSDDGKYDGYHVNIEGLSYVAGAVHFKYFDPDRQDETAHVHWPIAFQP